MSLTPAMILVVRLCRPPNPILAIEILYPYYSHSGFSHQWRRLAFFQGESIFNIMTWGHEYVIILFPFVFFYALPAEDTFRRQPFTVGLYLFHPLLYLFFIVSPPLLAYYSFAAPLSPFLICECDTSSASKPVSAHSIISFIAYV